jgi:outer membrane protein
LIVKRSAIVLLSALLFSGVASAASAQTKIGVVSIQKLARESPQGKAANEALTAEFLPKRKEIETQDTALRARADKLNKDSATMTQIQKTAAEKELQDAYRDLQLKQSQFTEALNEAQQDAQEKIGRVLDDEVKAFARAQGYDLILPDALYANPTLDVTESILQAMSRKAAAPAAAAPAAAPAGNKPPAQPAK